MPAAKTAAAKPSKAKAAKAKTTKEPKPASVRTPNANWKVANATDVEAMVATITARLRPTVEYRAAQHYDAVTKETILRVRPAGHGR